MDRLLLGMAWRAKAAEEGTVKTAVDLSDLPAEIVRHIASFLPPVSREGPMYFDDTRPVWMGQVRAYGGESEAPIVSVHCGCYLCHKVDSCSEEPSLCCCAPEEGLKPVWCGCCSAVVPPRTQFDASCCGCAYNPWREVPGSALYNACGAWRCFTEQFRLERTAVDRTYWVHCCLLPCMVQAMLGRARSSRERSLWCCVAWPVLVLAAFFSGVVEPVMWVLSVSFVCIAVPSLVLFAGLCVFLLVFAVTILAIGLSPFVIFVYIGILCWDLVAEVWDAVVKGS